MTVMVNGVDITPPRTEQSREERRDGYWLHWSGWIGAQPTRRLIGQWLAYPEQPHTPDRPFLCVVAGGRGEGRYEPGAYFDIRRPIDRPVIEPNLWLTPEGIALTDAEFERARARLHAFVDLVVAGRTAEIPQMPNIRLVAIDGTTGARLGDAASEEW